MSKIKDFLTETGIFFLATTDGNQPKIRPLGAFLEVDDKLIFGVGDFKNVYKQMAANPLVEIAACKPDGHAFHLDTIYNEQTGNKLMTFHLEDATAFDIAVMGKGESLL